MPGHGKRSETKMTTKQRLGAIFKVAQVTFKASPGLFFVQLGGALTDAILPIVITYFAALTTTSLAAAANGTEGAGQEAIAYVIATAFLGIVATAWTSIKRYLTQLMEYKIEAAVSDRMYEHFLKLDFWQYDDKDTIDNFDKANQFARFFPYIFNRLSEILRNAIGLIAGLVALTIVSWWLGLILIAAVIPGIIIQFKLSREQAQHWNTHVDTRRSKWMIENNMLQPQPIAELRLYGMVRFLLDLRLKLRDKDDMARIQFERKYIPLRLLADAIEAGAETIALVWTVFQIIGHVLPIGQFVYVQQIVSRAISGATGFVSTINEIDEDLINLVYYQAFMDAPESATPTKKFRGVPQSLQIENVSFRYPGTKRDVLKDVSFEVKRGQRIAIVGENGAGKTTLIKILTGLYKPTQGAVLLDGTSLADYDVNTWHKHLGVLQQQYLAYGFASVKDNIRYGDVNHPFDEERFGAAIDMAEAREFIEKLPEGINSYVSRWMEDDEGHRGVELSGGQWQRLALARNFYRNSPIVILDEPTSAIDALAESRIFKHLFETKDKTIITISHRLTTVKKAEVIYMMKNGELVEKGTHKELVDKKGAYYKMFESQL